VGSIANHAGVEESECAGDVSGASGDAQDAMGRGILERRWVYRDGWGRDDRRDRAQIYSAARESE